MKRYSSACFGGFFATCLAGIGAFLPPVGYSESTPNVLLIVTDDQGYSDFGFTGNPRVKTPVMDHFASQAAFLKNFVVAPACSPSRAAFYTGRDHLHTGVWGVPPRDNLHPDEALIPAFFKAAGYKTFYAGKRDMGWPPHTTPWDRGWDNGYFVSRYQHKDPVLPNRGATINPKGWTCDIMTDLILDFWKQNTNSEPWLVTAAYIIPHLPFVCDESYMTPFLEKGLSQDLALCYGSIAQLDAALGRLLAGLKDSGQEDNTIVVLVSDNGMSHRTNSGQEYSEKDWAIRDFHKLRGEKASAWENGIHVPCLIRWPGRIAPGSRLQIGAAEDLLPTVLDLAGVDPGGVSHLPFTGVSLRPVLENADADMQHPDLFRMAISGPGSPKSFGEPGNFEDHHLTLRGPRFKYHALPGGKCALYDIIADPEETVDIQAQLPEVVQKMAQEIRKRWDNLVAEGRCFIPVETPAKKTK